MWQICSDCEETEESRESAINNSLKNTVCQSGPPFNYANKTLESGNAYCKEAKISGSTNPRSKPRGSRRRQRA